MGFFIFHVSKKGFFESVNSVILNCFAGYLKINLFVLCSAFRNCCFPFTCLFFVITGSIRYDIGFKVL